MTVGYNRRASSTKAFALIAEGWNEIVQDGFTPDLVGTCPVTADSEVIFAASDDGDVVGVLTWTHHKLLDLFEVTLGYVEPSSRKRGVFAEMFADLLQRAKRAHVATVHIPIHPGNSVGRVVSEKLSGRPTAVIYEHAVA
jgi:predicted acetyltransferase